MNREQLEKELALIKGLQKQDPGEQVYMGNSYSAEQAVESENRHNREVREKLKKDREWIENKLLENLTLEG